MSYSRHIPPHSRPRLILSVDPVAAMRVSRKGVDPDPVHFALDAEMAGLEGIKAHLRLDRRHIQEQDVELFIRLLKSDFYLQMSTNQDVVHLVNTLRPKYIILVAERRDEVSTETGLDVALLAKQLLPVIREIDGRQTKVFLAVDPDMEQIRAAAKLEVHGLCISVRDYMLHQGFTFRKNDKLKQMLDAVQLSVKYGLETHLFNNISWSALPLLAHIPGVTAIHLGHQFISACMFNGIQAAVMSYRERLKLRHDPS